MDDDSDRSGIWQRLRKLFQGRHDADTVEKAIRDASKDGELDKAEGSMLLSVLNLDDQQVRDIMTPRMDIICAPEESSLREAAEMIMTTGHSRIPVFSGNRDNIIGILHAKDLLVHILARPEQEPDFPVAQIMREPFFVPETKNVLDLLHEFRTRKLHLAVIVDEYGGTAGLVTIEDVIEQIVGEIEDEHDAPRKEEISPQADGSYLIAGRAYLEDLEETLGLKINSDDVETLGGYLTHFAGRVPAAGDTFTLEDLGGVTFTVVDADVKQIRSVRMTKANEMQDFSSAGAEAEAVAAATATVNAPVRQPLDPPAPVDMTEGQNGSGTKA